MPSPTDISDPPVWDNPTPRELAELETKLQDLAKQSGANYDSFVNHTMINVALLETRLRGVADWHARARKMLNDAKASRIEKIEEDYGAPPVQAEIDYDKIIVKIH